MAIKMRASETETSAISREAPTTLNPGEFRHNGCQNMKALRTNESCIDHGPSTGRAPKVFAVVGYGSHSVSNVHVVSEICIPSPKMYPPGLIPTKYSYKPCLEHKMQCWSSPETLAIVLFWTMRFFPHRAHRAGHRALLYGTSLKYAPVFECW
jgi:hypothetical protein